MQLISRILASRATMLAPILAATPNNIRTDSLCIMGLARVLAHGIVESPLLRMTKPQAFLLAQETSGSISGKVLDPSGAIIPGASIEVNGTNLPRPIPWTSDPAGNYLIPNVPQQPQSHQARYGGWLHAQLPVIQTTFATLLQPVSHSLRNTSAGWILAICPGSHNPISDALMMDNPNADRTNSGVRRAGSSMVTA